MKKLKLPKKFETERLILRRLNKDDLDDVFEYTSDIETTQYMAWERHKTLQDTENYIDFCINKYDDGDFFDYAFVLKENNKLIGTGGSFLLTQIPHKTEIGYIINKKYWGQGLVKEAMEVLIDYLFKKLNLHRIESTHREDNPRSGRVMQKLGMNLEGKSIDAFYRDGKYYTVVNYGMINPEHKEKV